MCPVLPSFMLLLVVTTAIYPRLSLAKVPGIAREISPVAVPMGSLNKYQSIWFSRLAS